MSDVIIKNMTHKLLEADYEKLNLQVELKFTEESNVFKGHFDKMPILAGAIQLLLCEYWAGILIKNKLYTKEVSKVRFAGIIKPDEAFLIKVKIMPESTADMLYSVSCKIFKNNKRIMTATLKCQKALE
ncbi:MAG: hypothetical protein OEZ36_01720 [Spirochaetota bacterium]|nr:hypothetical protein [Spirochaetota bacterium]